VISSTPDPAVLATFLGDEPVVEARALDPGYSGHGSDVWLVRTDAEERIIRSSRLREEPDHEFWWGIKALFGVDPRDMTHFEAALRLLGGVPDIPVPRVLARKKVNGRDYLAVGRMKGAMLRSFTGQPDINPCSRTDGCIAPDCRSTRRHPTWMARPPPGRRSRGIRR
jgi:hypothetical protein